MSFFVYILYSLKADTFYKGQTNNIEDRVRRHNLGLEKFTSSGKPWKRLWTTTKSSRSNALLLESKLKNLSRKRLLEFMKKYSEGIVGHDEFLLIQKLH